MIDIIPAIDIIEGKCVRLSKGDYLTKKVYNENPLEVALQFADAGCRRLHVVDLDGAKSSHVVNYATLERLASRTNLIIDFGGGVKSDDDIKIAFSSGAAMVTGGSVAVKQPKLFRRWLATYGADKILQSENNCYRYAEEHGRERGPPGGKMPRVCGASRHQDRSADSDVG